MRLLPNAQAITEFLGYNGDCGQTAELVALHICLGLAENAANLNTIVRQEINDHEASASGAEPLNAIAQDLTERKVPHNGWPYAEPFRQDWQGCLKADAGIHPIILELANAQALPGDERGVHYHFICVVGVDDAGNYIVADGDNISARNGQLDHYSEAQLAAAQPCGLIEVLMPAYTPPPPPAPVVTHINEYFDEINGKWVVTAGHGDSSGKEIEGGLLAAYKTWNANGSQHGLTALGLPLANLVAIPGHAMCWYQVFERGVLIFDRDRVIDNPPGAVGDVYVAHTTYHP